MLYYFIMLIYPNPSALSTPFDKIKVIYIPFLPDGAPQAPLSGRGQGAQYKLILTLSRPNGMAEELQNESPRRKQRGIKDQNRKKHSPQAAGYLPEEKIKNTPQGKGEGGLGITPSPSSSPLGERRLGGVQF